MGAQQRVEARRRWELASPETKDSAGSHRCAALGAPPLACAATAPPPHWPLTAPASVTVSTRCPDPRALPMTRRPKL
uniref:Uncharacterized protein n=1 Tax=Arundo donax TaxID=35708 RepID=A0A0A9E1S0_ARUDO